MKQKLYTVADVASTLGVSRQTIHNWVDAGRFPDHFEVGEGAGKVLVIPASNVETVREEEAEKLIKKLNRLGFQAVSA